VVVNLAHHIKSKSVVVVVYNDDTLYTTQRSTAGQQAVPGKKETQYSIGSAIGKWQMVSAFL